MEINDRQDLVDGLPRKTVNTQPLPEQPADDITFTDDEIIEKARNAKNGPKFKLLFDYGDTGDYGGDQSRADLALCDLIKFWTKEADQIYRIVMKSALADGKWQRRDYADNTIALALSQADIEPGATMVDRQPQEVLDAIYQRAREIHETGDPVNYILNTYNSIHVGDRDLATGILCGVGCQSVSNSTGFQSKARGNTGKGKTHAVRAMCWLVPQEYLMAETLSDKALYYASADGDIKPGTIIFSDDVVFTPGIEDVIKQTTTKYQDVTVHRIPNPDRKQGGRKSLKMEIPPRIMWLLTSVDDSKSDQLINRLYGFGVDESEAQDAAFIEFESDRRQKGLAEFPDNEDVEICRELIRQIKQDRQGNTRLFSVTIPFAKRIVFRDTANRRNYNMFMDLVQSFAALRFRQRRCEDEMLVATEDDFKSAKFLYQSNSQNQMRHITEREHLFIQCLIDESGHADIKEMMKATGLSYDIVRRTAFDCSEKVPGFAIEKISVQEDDVFPRTTTQKWIYTYTGKRFDLADFEDVVSLEGGEK
jgi:hypothetical protein